MFLGSFPKTAGILSEDFLPNFAIDAKRAVRTMDVSVASSDSCLSTRRELEACTNLLHSKTAEAKRNSDLTKESSPTANHMVYMG